MSLAIDHLATSVATRRGTLVLGSAAAVLGLSTMGSASARKSKNRKACKKQAQEQVDGACGHQVDQCAAYFSSACGQFADPQRCFAVIKTCCAPLAECSFTEMIQCMTTTPME